MIYFNPRLIFQNMELWRLFTNFLFFGSLGGSHSLRTGLQGWQAAATYLSCMAASVDTCTPQYHIQGNQLSRTMLPCTAALTATVGLARLLLWGFDMRPAACRP